jgi:outer membrane protein assembly factor BamD (BamD/ComL family)
MSLLGKMAELDLLAAAKSSDDDQSRLQYCQAWYYSGLKQLLSGNQKLAGDKFAKCLATEQNALRRIWVHQARIERTGRCSAAVN